MFNLDDITNENNEDHNWKWPCIPGYQYRMLIIGDSESGKTNALLSLIKEKDSDELVDKTFLYANDLNEPKYQLLIKKREEAGMHLNYPKVFIEYSQYMGDVYNNIDNYNSNRQRKILIVFDDMIADVMTNKML